MFWVFASYREFRSEAQHQMHTCSSCHFHLLLARFAYRALDQRRLFYGARGAGSQGSRIESFGVDWRLYVLLVPLLPIIIYFACTTRTLCCCYSRMPCSLSATRAICCVVRALMLLLRFALSQERIALGDDYYLRNIRSAIDGKGLSLSSKRLCS